MLITQIYGKIIHNSTNNALLKNFRNLNSKNVNTIGRKKLNGIYYRQNLVNFKIMFYMDIDALW